MEIMKVPHIDIHIKVLKYFPIGSIERTRLLLSMKGIIENYKDTITIDTAIRDVWLGRDKSYFYKAPIDNLDQYKKIIKALYYQEYGKNLSKWI
jgi:hypothetical protein